jgi:hypothetical protein
MVAFTALVRCAVTCGWLLLRHRTHLPRQHLGMRLRFADGTSARVYRETIVDQASVDDPCLLVVKFRLRFVHGRAHALFRWESLLNTVLFLGFPGLVSKLWCAHDEHEVYRGVYEWDGAGRAEHYVRCLWRVLALVSEADSIDYAIVPGLRRDDALAGAAVLDASASDSDRWWRLVEAA